MTVLRVPYRPGLLNATPGGIPPGGARIAPHLTEALVNL